VTLDGRSLDQSGENRTSRRRHSAFGRSIRSSAWCAT
jgi:hypothetical protein